MKSTLSILGSIILMGVIGVNIYYNMAQNAKPTKTVTLEEAITKDLPGWDVEDLPLAETEAMLDRVNDILNFDEHISRTYFNETTEFTLYIAYWEPGKSSVVEVNRHTPDICWVSNGWELEERTHDILIDIGNMTFLPAQYRVFDKDGISTSVLFWHIVGNSFYRNKRNLESEYSFNPIKTLLQFGLSQKQEQFFVRIHSRDDVRKLIKDNGVEDLMTSLGKLCLNKPTRSLNELNQSINKK